MHSIGFRLLQLKNISVRSTLLILGAAVPWILSVQAVTSAIYHAPGWLPNAQSLIGH